MMADAAAKLKRKPRGSNGAFSHMQTRLHQDTHRNSNGMAASNGKMLVTVCSMGPDGTFEVAVKRAALVGDLVDAIAESRGIANARRLAALFLADHEDPLLLSQSVAGRMADTGARELFMMLRPAPNDRQILQDIYDLNDGAHWGDNGYDNDGWMTNSTTNNSGWRTDAPLGDWHGVTADADGNVTELDLGYNKKISALPESLNGLTSLRKLNLGYTSITGTFIAAFLAAPISQC
jgi:hypothetical protein